MVLSVVTDAAALRFLRRVFGDVVFVFVAEFVAVFFVGGGARVGGSLFVTTGCVLGFLISGFGLSASVRMVPNLEDHFDVFLSVSFSSHTTYSKPVHNFVMSCPRALSPSVGVEHALFGRPLLKVAPGPALDAGRVVLLAAVLHVLRVVKEL